MKTTIEMHGYEIVISEPEEGLLTVQAMKDGEVMEEFQLEGGEDHPEGEESDEMGSEEMGSEEMMPFGGEEEEDFGGEESEEDEDEEEFGEEEEEEEEEGKLESFNSFVKKRK